MLKSLSQSCGELYYEKYLPLKHCTIAQPLAEDYFLIYTQKRRGNGKRKVADINRNNQG